MRILDRIIIGFSRLISRFLSLFGIKSVRNLAEEGEKLARLYLKLHGYRILDAGWRWNRYELDIVARKKNTIAFVEVKTRSNLKFGRPQEAVDLKKQKHIKSAAKAYLSRSHLFDCTTRNDILEVLMIPDRRIEINHIKNAF